MKKINSLTLIALASVLSFSASAVQFDTPIKDRVFIPKLAPASIAQQSVSSDGSLPNDPEFERLQYSYMHSSLTEATVGNAFIGSWIDSSSKTLKKIRVGVIDVGFAPHPDINYSSEGADFFEGDNDPYSEQTMRELAVCTPHGTNVTSIIAAKSNNSVGIFGAGNNVEVVPVRVAACGEGEDHLIVDAINWLSGKNDVNEKVQSISNQVDVINISRGGYSECSDSMQEAVNYAYSKGIPIIAGAGNGGISASGFSPANCKNTISVASSDQYGNISSFSNYGETNGIVARGESVAMYGLTDATLPNKTYLGSGTSISTPLVTAAVANVQSVTNGLTPSEIKYLLLSSVTDFSDTVTCTIDNCGEGYLNNDKLVKAGEMYQAGTLSYIKQALPYGNECDKQLLIETFGEATPLCGLLELTINALATEKNHVSYNVYRAPKGTAIDVNDSSTELFMGDVHKTTQLVPDFDIESFDYGFTVCFSDDCSDDIIKITTYDEKSADCE
jgi:hypothetical protein